MDEHQRLTEVVPPSSGETPKRYRAALGSHAEVIRGWLANVWPNGYANSMQFRWGTIYSHGLHFPVARHVRIPSTGRLLCFFTKEDGSVTTQCHKTAIYRHVYPMEDRGIPVFHLHNVLADTRGQHRNNFDLLVAEADEYAGKWKRGRTYKEHYGDRAAELILEAFRYSCEIGLGAGLDYETPFPIVADWLRERDKPLLADLMTGRRLHGEVSVRSA